MGSSFYEPVSEIRWKMKTEKVSSMGIKNVFHKVWDFPRTKVVLNINKQPLSSS